MRCRFLLVATLGAALVLATFGLMLGVVRMLSALHAAPFIVRVDRVP